MNKIELPIEAYEDDVEKAKKTLKAYSDDNLKIEPFKDTYATSFKEMIDLIGKLQHLKEEYEIVIKNDIDKFIETEEAYVEQDEMIFQSFGGDKFG